MKKERYRQGVSPSLFCVNLQAEKEDLVVRISLSHFDYC